MGSKPAPEVGAKISGSFVDFSERTHLDRDLLGWSVSDWAEELSDMRSAGIDLVILARTMRYGCTYYFSRVYETHRETDSLSPFMRACEQTGMKVFLSAGLSDHFFTAPDEDFVRMMGRDVGICERVFAELLELYGDNPCVAGFYVASEADNRNLASPVRRDAARAFFGELYARLKRLRDLPVLSSPFFTKDLGPAGLAGFWDSFLDRPMFDLVAMQDGVGCDRDIAPEDIPSYYGGLAEVLRGRGIGFWNNVETFSFNPGFRRSGFDRSKIWLHPAPLGRVERQYRAGFPHVERTITWEYGHFLGRRQVGADWYEEFKRWNRRSDDTVL